MKATHIRYTTSALLCLCGLVLLWSHAYAEPPSGSAPIAPGSIVRFTQGGIVCLTQEALLEITLHSMNGDQDEVAAMQMGPDNPSGQCSMLDPKKRYKVLSVQYNNAKMPDLGLVEVVGEKASSSKGAWAYTLGVQRVSKP